ncbi:MAG: hypothetical protein RLY30_563 [Pseudomonadota bacterium]|jgi:type VI secretion system protein ImpA
MTQTSDLDADWLTELGLPLSSEAPSGPWLRYSDEFRQLEKLRINERDDLPLGEWQRPLIRADWRKTAQACREFLLHQSRDLHVAGWLCEALTETRQLAGLSLGLQAVLTLVQSQWNSLWPAMEEDDLDARIAPFIWLNRQMPICLRRNLRLLEPNLLRQEPVRLDDWMRWPAEDGSSDRSKAGIRKLVQPDDLEHLQALGALAAQTRLTLDDIEAILDAQLGSQSPGFSALKQLLSAISETAQALAQTNPAPAPKPAERPTPEASAPVRESATSNREDALALLQRAVESLQRHDPHSPATLLAARAALWGSMSLQQMAQFEASQGRALANTLELLGVPMQPPDRS